VRRASLLLKPVAVLIGLSALLTACQESEQRLRPQLSARDYTVVGESYSTYVDNTRKLVAENRSFVSAGKDERELEMNTPYALTPDPAACAATKGGFVLFHGLSDSPFMVRDIAEHLRAQCYLVWAPLLPGHGTRPGDMLRVTSEDWLDAGRAALTHMRAQTETVHVGGFSMGGVLAMILALEQPDLKSVVLFSPAAKAKSRMLWAASWLRPFYPWVDRDIETEMPRYEAFSAHAAAQYYDMTRRLDRMVRRGGEFKMPVFAAVTINDSVVDTAHMTALFKSRMKDPASRLMVFQTTAQDCVDADDERVLRVGSNLPEQRINGFSHLSVPTSPRNWYYGREGVYRNCERYSADADLLARCQKGDDVWFGEYGERVEGRIFARLSYNPRFDDMIAAMNSVLGETAAPKLLQCPAA